MEKSHYIYLLYDENNQSRFLSTEVHKISRKIGSTCNMKTRMKPYLTGHPDKVPIECYYQIKNPENNIENFLNRLVLVFSSSNK